MSRGPGAALFALLCASVLMVSHPLRWPDYAFGAGVFAVGLWWGAEAIRRGAAVRVSAPALALAGAVAWGLWQLAAGVTAYRFATWDAVLRWGVYLALFFVSAQAYAGREAGLRRAMVYFGFGLSVVSTLQMFTSGGKIFWMFETQWKDFVLGPFVNQDHYAALMELVLPVAIFEAGEDRRKTLGYALMAGAMFASVIAGASRAGAALVTAEVFVLTVVAMVRGPRGRNWGLAGWIAVVAIVFTAVVGWEVLWQRFQERDPYRDRKEMVLATVAMFRERPATGFGLGTFETVFPAYALADDGTVVNHAHNDWAEWAGEGGLPFVGLMLWLAGWALWTAVRRPWAAGAVAAFAHSFIDYPLQVVPVAAWMFVMLGAASGGREKPRAD